MPWLHSTVYTAHCHSCTGLYTLHCLNCTLLNTLHCLNCTGLCKLHWPDLTVSNHWTAFTILYSIATLPKLYYIHCNALTILYYLQCTALTILYCIHITILNCVNWTNITTIKCLHFTVLTFLYGKYYPKHYPHTYKTLSNGQTMVNNLKMQRFGWVVPFFGCIPFLGLLCT